MTRIVVLTLVACMMAACGGPKKEEAPAAPDTSASAPAPEAAPAAPAPEAAPAPAAAEAPKGDAAAGKDQFTAYCSSCHGPDAKGVKGLGKDLTTSQFVASKTDAELLAYVKQGRAVDDPLNTTGVPMPPKGGNPALTDQEIANIIAHVRTIHQ